MKDLKIAVAGTGYVGLSIATLLSQHHQVTAVDVIPEKVDMLNRKQSPIQDEYIEKYLSEKALNLTATLDGAKAYSDADFVVIAAPTNYDPVKNYFDTHHIEDVIDLVLSVNPDAVMVIKSTIPVGYCRGLYLKYARKGVKKFNLLFSPEFLRESMALYDNLYPSRIIVGYPKIIDRPEFAEENEAIRSVTDVNMLQEVARTFAALLQEGAIKENIDTLFMGMKEAEAVKLFANTYLTKQEVVDEGTLPYTFSEDNPDEKWYGVNAYTSYAKIRSTMSDGRTSEKTEYRQININPSTQEGLVLGYLYITQDEADNFRLVSTSFNEIPLGENEINPHRFVYTLEYNCFTVNLEFDVFYPSCTVFDPATGEQKTHWMPMLPLDKNCFTVSEPELRYMGENTDENGPMSEYYYRQEYLFQVNRDVEPTEYDYQLLSRHMYVAHY